MGTAPLAGSSVTTTTATQAGRGREPDTFWDDYGYLLAAFWVIFLIFPALSIANSSLALGLSLLGYGLIGCFAVIYLLAFYRFRDRLGAHYAGNPGAWLPFLLLLGVALAGIPLLGANTVSYGPFIISYAAYLLSRRAMWWITALTLVLSVYVALASGQLESSIFLLGMLLVLAIINPLNTMLIRHGSAEAKLRVENLMLMEQERMARDVHDALGHSLTAVGLKAQLAERLLDTDLAAARAELQHINALTIEAMDSIRATVGGLRRTTLAQELLSARAVLDDAGVTAVVRGDAAIVDPPRSAALSWILREAVTNVLRHAHATTCWISIEERSMSIEDDGDSLTGSHEGHGIRGMRERARLTAARIVITESVHGGTRVALSW
ncbi:sensor histidine kinase [Arthrobacter psychrolactophilus]|uniref:Sensor histidine kinase n=1 Tax=Arthrobacter psychrolactophilus TaxID=92442 RepID=A0A2V5IUA6_9MICC|nr:histidine kinase [Arthrobacter psychrolactophilus]PYI37764.1 sensor histidine kinase [Arthrobacter psychrolactophilus]